MLSDEQNLRLMQVGAGTPMGELLRRYWMPIAAFRLLRPCGPAIVVGILNSRWRTFKPSKANSYQSS
jgi:hypothetical protein